MRGKNQKHVKFKNKPPNVALVFILNVILPVCLSTNVLLCGRVREGRKKTQQKCSAVLPTVFYHWEKDC